MSDPAFGVPLARRGVRLLLTTMVSGLALLPVTSHALRYDFDFLGGIQANLNTSLSLGGQWRLQNRDPDLIGKANLNPAVCRSSCQPQLSTPPDVGQQIGRVQLGLEGEGDFVNQLGLSAPGGGSLNNDDGNLNFDQYETTQAAAQITQDLELDFANFGFLSSPKVFIRYNAFHDFVNYNRDQYYPTFYTPADRARDDDRHSDGDPSTAPGGEFGFPTPGTATFRPLPSEYNEYLGQDIDLYAAYMEAYLPTAGLFGTDIGDLQVKIGQQTINWGESTLLVVNSLNTFNPPNVNALFRPAFLDLATVFKPIGAITISAPLSLNTSFQAFYQYDWDKIEIPPRGGFLSFIDLTLDGGSDNIVNPGFGQVTDDRDGNARAEQQLLTGISDTQGNVPVFEKDASNDNQYGFAFTWYLPTFNNGTELRFYYAKYNSRLPYFSAIAGQESCLQAMPDGLFASNSDDLVDLSNDCPQQDTAQTVGAIVQHLSGERAAESAFLAARAQEGSDADRSPSGGSGNMGGQGYTCGDNPPGTGPCAEAYVLDSFKGLLEYPEGINMFGISFNTSFGDISVQGEVAYRPNLPLQVDDVDVAFTALQPTAPLGCAGANGGPDCQPGTTDDVYAFALTLDPTAGTLSLPGGGTVIDLNALPGGVPQEITDLIADQGITTPTQVYLSDAPGRANAFPSFLQRYRGQRPGSIQGSLPDRSDTPNIDESRPGDYIQGYERFQVFQYNLGATYVIGPGNWIKSDQVILFFELGATQVLGFPQLSELQIEGDGTFYHASVGSDGSGAAKCPDGVIQGEAADPDSTRTRRALSTICGKYQGRFNSTQQQGGFATAFSWGSRVIGIIRYENVLPGISIEPLFVIGYDVDGTAPGPGPNFIEGRELYVLNVEMRWQQHWSVTGGVTVFRGAEPYNLLADRDFFQLGVQYRF